MTGNEMMVLYSMYRSTYLVLQVNRDCKAEVPTLGKYFTLMRPTEVCVTSPGRQDFSLKSRIKPCTQIWGRLPKVGLGLVQDL